VIAPHGGELVQRYASGPEAEALRDQARALPVIRLNERQLSDAHMIAQGAYSPLKGFMASADYQGVVQTMRLSSGLAWSLPVTLAIEPDRANAVHEGHSVALAAPDGKLAGILEVEEVYPYDKEAEALQVFRTGDEHHPGVANTYQQGELLVGGPLLLFEPPVREEYLAPYYRTPAETRQEMTDRGWKTMVGFQTRNPVHRAHEYIQKSAMEAVDGLLLHPLVGETKADDIPAPVRMRCYEALISGYYPQKRVLLSVFPAFMRYAGPREAIFHALVRKNYGCTHFIVGRDHAGVGNYYGTYDAQQIFREFDDSELGIVPLFFENAFFCKACGAMATAKTCPHGLEEQVSLSGTQVRAMLSRGELPPPEFTRPEVARVLAEVASAAGARS